jgi:putative addiction module component (TIGR02574 family)
MPTSMKDLGIDRLSVSERVALADEILASVAAERSPPLPPDARRAELARRAAEDDAGPDDVVPLDQVKANLQARFGP